MQYKNKAQQYKEISDSDIINATDYRIFRIKTSFTSPLYFPVQYTPFMHYIPQGTSTRCYCKYPTADIRNISELLTDADML